MSINLESRQLVMQISSHLIKQKRERKKRSTYFKNLCEINRLSAAAQSLPLGQLHLPIHHGTRWLAIFPAGLEAWTGKTWKSTRSKLLILTDEELKPEETKVFSKNINLVAKLVQKDPTFPNYLSYLPCSLAPHRFYYDKASDAFTSLYLDSKFLKGG